MTSPKAAASRSSALARRNKPCPDVTEDTLMQSAISLSICRRAAMFLALCLGLPAIANAATTLSGAEYFIDPTPWIAKTKPCDNDPGQGKGTPLPPTDGSWNSVMEAVKQTGANPSQLPPGVHDLCVRFKDSKGRWGPTRFIHFTSFQGLTACEYYIKDSNNTIKSRGSLNPQDDAFDSPQENLLADKIPTTGLSVGTYTIGARCKNEWGHWGKTKTAEFNIPPPNQPDFVVSILSIYPSSPAANSSFKARLKVRNRGQGDGDGGQLAIWANQPAKVQCNATPDKTVAVGNIPHGQSQSIDLTVDEIPAGGAGSKVLRAFVDSNCATAEFNKANNQATHKYRVGPPPLVPAPDFVITNVDFVPDPPIAAQSTFKVKVTVKNQGTLAGDGVYLDGWADQPTKQICGAEGDDYAVVGNLAPGESKTVTVTLPAGNAGTKTFRAFVDSWCETSESKENNNQFTKPYRVQ